MQEATFPRPFAGTFVHQSDLGVVFFSFKRFERKHGTTKERKIEITILLKDKREESQMKFHRMTMKNRVQEFDSFSPSLKTYYPYRLDGVIVHKKRDALLPILNFVC